MGVRAIRPALLTIVALLGAFALTSPGAGWRDSPLPTGLFVPDQPLEMCVAIELGPDTTERRGATVYWWTVASSSCSARSSGITRQPAVVNATPLPAVDGLPARRGYEVTFSVGMIPSGTREISFTLDPEFARRNGLALAALRPGEAIPTLTFRQVDQLVIPGPEDEGPVATPQLAPAT